MIVNFSGLVPLFGPCIIPMSYLPFCVNIFTLCIRPWFQSLIHTLHTQSHTLNVPRPRAKGVYRRGPTYGSLTYCEHSTEQISMRASSAICHTSLSQSHRHSHSITPNPHLRSHLTPTYLCLAMSQQERLSFAILQHLNHLTESGAISGEAAESLTGDYTNR